MPCESLGGETLTDGFAAIALTVGPPRLLMQLANPVVSPPVIREQNSSFVSEAFASECGASAANAAALKPKNGSEANRNELTMVIGIRSLMALESL